MRLAGALVLASDSGQVARDFLLAASASERIHWAEDEKLEWDTQMVYLAHHTHVRLEQSETTYRHLVDLATRADAYVVANARSCKILTGLGLCHRRAGRYTQAIESYQSAAELLARLERAPSLASVNGALSACYRDTGDLEAQREHALRATSRPHPMDYFQISAAFYGFEACYLLGDTSNAMTLLRTLDSVPFSRLRPQTLQVLLICQADAAWVEGRARAALEFGHAAIKLATQCMPRNNVSGIARWLAVLRERGQWSDTMSEIVDQTENLQGVCWWDEMERLSALARLRQGTSAQKRHETNLGAALERLPPTASSYLRRYGLQP